MRKLGLVIPTTITAETSSSPISVLNPKTQLRHASACINRGPEVPVTRHQVCTDAGSGNAGGMPSSWAPPRAADSGDTKTTTSSRLATRNDRGFAHSMDEDGI